VMFHQKLTWGNITQLCRVVWRLPAGVTREFTFQPFVSIHAELKFSLTFITPAILKLSTMRSVQAFVDAIKFLVVRLEIQRTDGLSINYRFNQFERNVDNSTKGGG